MLVKYVLSDGISQAFLPFRFVDEAWYISDGLAYSCDLFL
jgi:hypothetical protein